MRCLESQKVGEAEDRREEEIVEKRKMKDKEQRERVLQRRKEGKITEMENVSGRIKAEDGKQGRTEKWGMK